MMVFRRVHRGRALSSGADVLIQRCPGTHASPTSIPSCSKSNSIRDAQTCSSDIGISKFHHQKRLTEALVFANLSRGILVVPAQNQNPDITSCCLLPRQDFISKMPLELTTPHTTTNTTKHPHPQTKAEVPKYHCRSPSCSSVTFSSIDVLRLYESEVHNSHSWDMYMCSVEECEREVGGTGFPRSWNLMDHMNRVVHGVDIARSQWKGVVDEEVVGSGGDGEKADGKLTEDEDAWVFV